jgi:alpha-glucosidase
LNGKEAKSAKMRLSFLGAGNHPAVIIRDKLDDPAAVGIEKKAVTAGDVLVVEMRPGGGFIARLDPAPTGAAK